MLFLFLVGLGPVGLHEGDGVGQEGQEIADYEYADFDVAPDVAVSPDGLNDFFGFQV